VQHASYTSRIGSTNDAALMEKILAHDEAEYIGTLVSINMRTKMVRRGYIHEQYPYHISL
jgi:hypothetical protein